MKILISRGNIINAKSYPYWEEFLLLVKDHEIKEIKGILTTTQIIELVNWCDVWISIDSFLPHLCDYHKLKNGVVIWGMSDPLIFGYKNNKNILKDRKYLRPDQFNWWKDVKSNSEVFVSPETLLKSIFVV